MIDYLLDQLGNEFKVIERESTIEIHRMMNGVVDQETSHKITRIRADLWELAEVNRGQVRCLAQFENRDLGCCGAFLATVSFLDSESISLEVKPEWNNVHAGINLNEVQTVLETYVNPKYFSILDEKNGTIHLDQTNSGYHVCYLSQSGERIRIVENRKAPNVFNVVWTYAKKLQKFDVRLVEWEERMPIDSFERDKLIKIYLRLR